MHSFRDCSKCHWSCMCLVWSCKDFLVFVVAQDVSKKNSSYYSCTKEEGGVLIWILNVHGIKWKTCDLQDLAYWIRKRLFGGTFGRLSLVLEAGLSALEQRFGGRRCRRRWVTFGSGPDFQPPKVLPKMTDFWLPKVLPNVAFPVLALFGIFKSIFPKLFLYT